MQSNRGRKPEPALLDGGPEKGEAPDMPEWIQGLAKDEWYRVIGWLVDEGKVGRNDGPALAAYCHCYGEVQKLAAEIEREGMTAIGSMEQLRPHPLLAVQDRMLTQLLKWMQEFGMTPASRKKTGGGGPEAPRGERDALAEFLS